jgi:DNA-directed RNA polymerase
MGSQEIRAAVDPAIYEASMVNSGQQRLTRNLQSLRESDGGGEDDAADKSVADLAFAATLGGHDALHYVAVDSLAQAIAQQLIPARGGNLPKGIALLRSSIRSLSFDRQDRLVEQLARNTLLALLRTLGERRQRAIKVAGEYAQLEVAFACIEQHDRRHWQREIEGKKLISTATAPALIQYVETLHFHLEGRYPIPCWLREGREQVGSDLVTLAEGETRLVVGPDRGAKVFVRQKKNILTSDGQYTSESTLTLTPEAQEVVDRGDAEYVDSGFEARPLPYLPKPWRGMYEGGFVTHEVPFIRKRHDVREALEATEEGRGSLAAPMVASDSLGHTSWTVNPRVLEVLRWGLDKGMFDENSCWDYADNDEWDDWGAERVVDRPAITRRHELLAVVRMIDEHLDGHTFHQPHSIDFRGRLYPLASRLHVQRSSVERALLLFADSAPLGDREGYEWFMRAGATAMGLDKEPVEDQVAAAEATADIVRKIAADPIASRAHWENQDKPFEFLAWAFEYARYLDEKAAWDADRRRRGEIAVEVDTSADVYTDFETGLPMELDGSCNAFQHYALLARDHDTAIRVNLVPGWAHPQDLYADVAEEVEERLADLMVHSEDVNTRRRAKAWFDSGLVGRKLAKSPTMTVSYGSTPHGRRKALRKFLRTEAPDGARQVVVDVELSITPEGTRRRDYDPIAEAARWIESKIQKATDDLTRGAVWVRRFLQECAGAVAKAGHDVAWLSPSGFLVCQILRKRDSAFDVRIRSRVTGEGGRYTSNLHFHRDSDTPDVRKSKSSIPPNFVHALDAAHLVRVIGRAEADGIAIGAVHDAVRVRPGDAARLQRILLEELAALHRVDLLADFRDQLAARFPAAARKLPNIERLREKHPGHLDPDEIVDAKFAFA